MTENKKKLTKGEQTALRILDAAETLFADNGFDGTTTKMIAEKANIQEPGIYNYYASKDEMYRAVLDRAIKPVADKLKSMLENESPLQELIGLAAEVTTVFAKQPHLAALFQQNLLNSHSEGTDSIVDVFMLELLGESKALLDQFGRKDLEPQERIIRLLLMSNITMGYFTSGHLLERFTGINMLDEKNLNYQKELITDIARTLIGSLTPPEESSN